VTDPQGPLAGLRVVESATLAAGPMAGTWWGEYGDVIKVEDPVAGDPMRTWGYRKHGIGDVQERRPEQAVRDLRSPPAGGEKRPPRWVPEFEDGA
jgi:crotonobetainyl-CoA:carnitine CoA-transferase CaiB-like acyl-CoA transferase